MEGDQQLEAVATHPKQKTIYGSPSLAEMYLTGVVDDIGQRDIFTVPGALDHGLPCGQSLLSRLQILLSLCKSCRTLSSLEILLLSGPSSAIHACSLQNLCFCLATNLSSVQQLITFSGRILSLPTFSPSLLPTDLFTPLAQFCVTMCDTAVFPVWLCCALREVTSSSSLCTGAAFLHASPWHPALFPL